MSTPEQTRPYRPSNGSEGDAFTSSFCDHCRGCNPNPDESPQCEILLASIVHDIHEPGYPKEWIQDQDGKNPRCTAYIFHDWDQGPPEEIFPEPPNQLHIPLEPIDMDHNMAIPDSSQPFDDYLGEARDRFVRKIQEQDWSTPLRMEAENILIAYDQARQTIKNHEIALKHYQGLASIGVAPRPENVFSFDDMMDIAGFMAAADPTRPIHELKAEAEIYIRTKKLQEVMTPAEIDEMLRGGRP
jgi:hypothetical protein